MLGVRGEGDANLGLASPPPSFALGRRRPVFFPCAGRTKEKTGSILSKRTYLRRTSGKSAKGTMGTAKAVTIVTFVTIVQEFICWNFRGIQ